MQSFLQYRRLRWEVQEDLVRAQQTERSAGSTPNTSTPESKGEKLNQEGPKEEDSKNLTLVPGVTVSRPDERNGSVIFEVGWKENDPSNPLDWTLAKKWMAMLTCCALAIPLTMLTSIEGPTQDAFNVHFGVNAMAGSMTTGIFLIGIGVGSLFSGPFSETFGRNAIYFSTMVVVLLFIMAKALAPSYGAALAFRFLCALFAASPMTVAGGTIGDIWTPMQLPFGLPLVTFAAYAGPILGPVIGAYTPKIGFAWEDWISMIIVGAALVFVLLAQPETYSPVLLEWRAKHLRELTGDSRYQAKHASANSLGTRLLTNLYRPFTMIWTEPIILRDISVWSPIVASGVFGYALVCIFTTSYMYIIFVYLQYAASALGFMTFSRYIISGALSPASVKMYDNLGPHLALTIVAIVATVMAPVPFILYKYGHKVRAMSKHVQNKA
ncbi:MAG: hypothetical protein Q9225_006054 [Loekoesia sp. 1 TL-2023]